MSARITPLRLEGFEQLPKHARRCVFWEVDPSTLGTDDHLSDPEFEKEAWLSMVMLEWGSCGQLAVQAPPDDGSEFGPPITGDEACLGYAFYAPPGAVPRARLYPSGPVSADAVLLTGVGVDGSEDTHGVTASLLAGVVGDLVRRGVRALEAFGYTTAATELNESGAVPDDLAAVTTVLGDCSVDKCMTDADFLQDIGFVVVSAHQYFPRLRLELDKGLGWKAEVEAALERLLESARLEMPVGAGMTGAAMTGPAMKSVARYGG
ncbi:acetyltransferase [Mycobacterium sp. 21AC1]|uniref:acetyltransferase n=1 Tax=[Mycobacterium] appelbergii TaxID=2939269 RepID=UPI00293908B1|nr:acetyltransferase [Mycobacterium sp. 21AC1]MDV3123394.1 acetyltransferase [Mycobacterium sp. 21AC1]